MNRWAKVMHMYIHMLKRESADPSSITRVDVWCRGHTKKSGEVSSQVVANCLEKIQEFKASHPLNVSPRSYEDDALAHVLGPERRGRFRGIGSGVNASKLKFRAQSYAKDQQSRGYENMTQQKHLLRSVKVLQEIIKRCKTINLLNRHSKKNS